MATLDTARIEIIGLVKRYHFHPVLDHLSLTLEDGCFCLLIGANGAGKTTLLRILAGLTRPDEGEIAIGNAEEFSDPLIRQNLGFIGHEPMFYHDLTAEENLHHYAQLYALENYHEKINHSLNITGLSQYRDQPLRTFSRGMQQRLSLARAFLHNPSILLLDEPYTNLDPQAASVLDNQLRTMSHSGCTILLAAHRPQRLLSVATHIAWLKSGKIYQHLPISQLADSPELSQYMRERE